MSNSEDGSIETNTRADDHETSGVNNNHGVKLQPPILDLTVDRYAAYMLWKEKWDDYVLLSTLIHKHQQFKQPFYVIHFHRKRDEYIIL